MHLSRQPMPIRALLALLIALTLTVRLAVPAGYMPAQGKAALELCAGQLMDAPRTAAMPIGQMPMKGMEHGKHAPPEGEHNCAFSAVGGAVDLPTIVVPSAPLFAPVAILAIRRLAARPGLGLAAPPPPKTGPPSFLR